MVSLLYGPMILNGEVLHPSLHLLLAKAGRFSFWGMFQGQREE